MITISFRIARSFGTARLARSKLLGSSRYFLIMSSCQDWNELDRAIHALGKSTAALPEVYRQLTKGNLCALMPYHPEIEGETLQIQNGSLFNFVMVQAPEGGEVVLIFSSEERAEESLTAGNVPPNTFCVARMKARQMLEILGAMNMTALLNKGCATGAFLIPPDMMRDLASGEALKPSGMGTDEGVEQTFKIVEPADYPTNLIQPLFETLRRDRKFRAAWVLRKPELTAEGGTHYALMILMDPRDEVLAHDFNVVLSNSVTRPDEVMLSFVDETDQAYIAQLLKAAAPFYRAPDFDASLEAQLR